MRVRGPGRFRIGYESDRPRFRLGVVWFVGAVAVLLAGTVAQVVYFGVVFGAGAAHTARTWRARGAPVDPRVALVCTVAVVAASGFGPQIMGVGLLAATLTILALSVSELEPGAGFSAALARSGLVLQAFVPCAVGGGCLVLLAGIEAWAAIALLVVCTGYESGDYLIGTGSASAVEGPAAGSVAVVVSSAVVAALGFPPFGVAEAMVLGVLVAPTAILGQFFGSAMLPHARAFAPALRRVDSLLVAAPLRYAAVDLVVV